MRLAGASRSVTAGGDQIHANTGWCRTGRRPRKSFPVAFGRFDPIEWAFAIPSLRRLPGTLHIGPIPRCRAHCRNIGGTGYTSWRSSWLDLGLRIDHTGQRCGLWALLCLHDKSYEFLGCHSIVAMTAGSSPRPPHG